MRENYDKTAEKYRRDDEIDATGHDHDQLCSVLREISLSFDAPVMVLDIGCGTGRHFHCLCNVQKLVGIDVSQNMLEQAVYPVKKEEAPEQRELICANFYNYDFAPGTFHFIYSIGVFGNGCALTPELCAKLVRWLKPDGQLFFDVFDAAGLSLAVRVRKRIRSWIYRLLPGALQEKWDKRTGWVPAFLITEPDIRKLLQKSGLESVSVNRRLCNIPGGEGWKLQCRAVKRKIKAMAIFGVLTFINPRTNSLLSAFEGSL
jgi:SAM-dependent methyltransferase